jgi:hypothetical protein
MRVTLLLALALIASPAVAVVIDVPPPLSQQIDLPKKLIPLGNAWWCSQGQCTRTKRACKASRGKAGKSCKRQPRAVVFAYRDKASPWVFIAAPSKRHCFLAQGAANRKYTKTRTFTKCVTVGSARRPLPKR